MFPATLALALALAPTLAPTAAAAEIPRVKNVRIRQNTGIKYRVQALSPDADAEVAVIEADVDGTAVPLAEADAWLHGTAALAALPAEGATVTLTVYDIDSVAIGSYTGAVTGGALRLVSTGDRGDTGECASRTGCDGYGDDTTALDLEVLAATLHADGSVGLDLAGADVLSVAAATLSSEELTDTDTCAAYGRDGSCVAWETLPVVDAAEVALDELGIVWESEELDLEAGARLTVLAEDERGKKLDRVRVDVVPAWADLGGGQSALAIDEDPLTTLATVPRCGNWSAVDSTCQEESSALVVVSDGWSAEDDLPELAEVEVEGGETWEIPVHGYQRTGVVALDPVVLADDALTFSIGGVEATSRSSGGRRVLSWEGVAPYLVIVEEDEEGNAWASLTTWASSPADLPDTVVLTPVSALLSAEEELEVALDEELAAVFGVDLELASDGWGADLVGEVELKGAADARGRRGTVARGRFAGQLGTDGDGDLDLAAIDPDGGTVSRGDILIGGEPIGIERTVGDEGVPQAPPAAIYKVGGRGTRNTASHTEQTQQAELL